MNEAPPRHRWLRRSWIIPALLCAFLIATTPPVYCWWNASKEADYEVCGYKTFDRAAQRSVEAALADIGIRPYASISMTLSDSVIVHTRSDKLPLIKQSISLRAKKDGVTVWIIDQ
jgi:hypothetical protein